MAAECLSLAVIIDHLLKMLEHSEMIINTDCLTTLTSELAELVISSHNLTDRYECSNEFIVAPVQEMTFTFGELVIGTLCRLHACKVKV